MGSILSYLGFFAKSNEPDPETGLTPREKMLVGNTWNLVKKDMIYYGSQIFIELVTKYPEYKKLFPFRDVPNEELANNRKLKAHATNVMYALSSVLDNLNNNEVLIDILEKTGESHGKKNIKEKAYWDLKVCVLEVLETGLGSKFTNETKEAWDKTITVAFTVINKALKEQQTHEHFVE